MPLCPWRKYVEMIGNLCLDYKRDPFFAKMRKGLFKDGKQRFLFGENEKKFINPSKGRVHNPQNGIHSSLFNNIIGEKVHQMVFLEINILWLCLSSTHPHRNPWLEVTLRLCCVKIPYHGLEARVELDKECGFQCHFQKFWIFAGLMVRKSEMGGSPISHHGLEARVKLDKEGGLECHGKHPLLHQRALDVVVLNVEVFR